MVNLSFNSLLLSKLTDVLDLSGNEIANRCKLSQTALYHYMKGEVEMPVQALMQICNALRMPTRYFLSVNNRHIIPTRETATIEADRWKPITWSLDAVELTFGDGEDKIYWKDVASIMGLTPQKPHERFLLRTRFPINSFLLTCTHFNLSPFLFLKDENQPADIGKAKRQTAASPQTPTKPRTAPSYAELAHRVDLLEHDLADLKQKFTALLQDQQAFLRRMPVNIQDVHNSHIGINDRVDMAAEKQPGEK